jgi:energy-coupling factor transporter ATP-binding protein EcfA2
MKKRRITEKLDEIIAFSGIEHHVDTPVKRYSSGMYVRLAFAVAAHLDSDILIADEVLAVGDTEFQKKALGKMQDLSTGQGRTVLFVSHNLGAVKSLCDCGVVLEKGEIVCNEGIDNIIDKYINNSTKELKYQKNGYICLDEFRGKMHLANVFKGIKISDKFGQISNVFSMLSPMVIDVEMENTDNYPNADYCIAIISSDGQWVTSFATWMYGLKYTSPRKLQLKISSIKFAPGIYRIYLSMTHHAAGEYIDRIEHSALFNVECGDIFNTGKEFTANEGLFFAEGELLLL